MDATDLGGDDRTFRVNFSSEGADKLRERVKEKLKEFMGDYTDDTLVEYVIVLLRNGRRKDEARKELNVFLGDDCVSFVSWLWDHLSSNLHLYVQSKESFSGEAAKTQSISSALSERHNVQLEHVNDSMQTDSRNRRNREWKGLVPEETEPFSLQSTVMENFSMEEKTRHRPSLVRQSRSPRTQAHRKRNRRDEPQSKKRDTTSQPIIGASRRLLQFAVRDAVRTVQQTRSRVEPALKRLRSVVSTSTTNSVLEERPRTISVARGVSTAVKAAAEAAEDAIKLRCSGNVFDRLGHGLGKAEIVHQSPDFREPELEGGSEDFDQIPGSNRSKYYQNGEYVGEFTENMTMLERDTEMAADSASDDDDYDRVSIARHQGPDVSQSASSANKDKGSLMVQYSVAQDADDVVRKTRLIDQDPPAVAAASASRKIVNISVNVNTWKPPHYKNPSVATEVGNQITGEKSNAGVFKPNVQFLKEKNAVISKKETDVATVDVQKEAQNTMTSTNGSYTTGRPSDDVDSRTLFVSNVHFAATKDNLSRHFNKFGEVLKVIIVTDATTGQPKGSAYIEFLRKDSADLALSLNGTSFMSRILKVVRRASANQEAALTTRWPRIARASAFAPRLCVPFPRGTLTGAFPARLPVKPGARSLQWKRDSPTTPGGAKSLQNASLTSGNTILSPTGRNLTYIRKDPKQDGISGPTLAA